MRTGRFFFLATSCLMLVFAALADERMRALADAGLLQGKPVTDRSLHLPQPVSVPFVKKSPTASRNHGLATIGGPAKAFRSTAVINGTNMKRKP